MPKVKVPCYKCDKRHPCCHGSCDDYKKYQKDREDKANTIAAGRSLEKIYTDYHADIVTKTKKKFNHK